jgi:hypothetical protein
MTDVQIDLEDCLRAQSTEPKKNSGYRRLQVRHHSLIHEHEALKRDYGALLSEHHALENRD